MSLSPLYLSVKVALLATMFAFIFGVLAAFLVVRLGRFQGVIDALFTLPLVLPPTVVGFFILILVGRNSTLGGFLEHWGIKIIFTPAAAVIASIIVAFPLMYRTARGAFEQINVDYIDVARTLGKGEWWIFFQVILPNSWPGILAGTVLAFARALGEFGATIMVSGNIPGKTQTMAIAVYTAMQANNRELAWRWVLLLLGISFVILLLLNGWLRVQQKNGGRRWN